MLNKNKNEIPEDLTVEKVKQFKGFENISDEEAENIAYSLKQFSLLTYRYYQRQKKKESDTS